MRGFLGQTLAVAGINLRGLANRKGLVVAITLSVALVVATLMSLDALKQGLRIALEQAGRPDVAIVLRGGSQAEINSIVTREQVDILRGAPALRSFSPEVNLVVDGYRREDGQRANISLRGLMSDGVQMRRNVRLVDGRWPTVGSAELTVGRNIARTYRNMDLGATVTVGTAKWTIVGVFTANGSIADSEIWADLTAVQSLFNRANTVQSVRMEVAGSSGLESISSFSAGDPRLQLAVRSEADYYAAQAARTSDLAQKLAWPLAVLMAIGAVVGALNTMLAAVTMRSVEIATFRAIGFRRSAICFGLLIECLIVCLVAASIGAAVAYLILDGLGATTLASGITRVGYALKFSLSGLWQGLGLGAAIAVLGTIIPAIIAGLRPVTRNLAP
ncbi:MAG: ABC transporter permease [Pseudomonadota bacterium]